MKSQPKQFFLFMFLSAVGLSCAHRPLKDPTSDFQVARSLTDVLKSSATLNGGSSSISPSELWVQGKKIQDTNFDFPVIVNSRVEFWIDYFCGRGRPHFTKYLERSEYFIPFIKPILKQQGMPEDLVYLAMVESGFNNLARSRARAVGPWQFIQSTGKRYGLNINSWVDERRDIQKSTLAAVEYLRDLYQMFQNWELAAAAYNAGEGKILRAIRQFSTKDFWMIARHRFLKPETRDYVPKIMAAAIISKNRTQFGFPETKIQTHSGQVIAGDGEVVQVEKTEKPLGFLEDSRYRQERENDFQEVLEESSGVSTVSEVNLLNLEKQDLVAVVANPSSSELAPEEGDSTLSITTPLAKPIPTPHITKTGEVGGEDLDIFEVQGPADLLQVAKAAGLSYQTVKSLNPEILRWCTPPHLGTYRIKLPSSTKETFLTNYNHKSFPRKVRFMTYKVKRGETLSYIARHFGFKVDLMSDLNRVSPKSPLRLGARILLPIPSDRTRTFAALDIIDPPERRRVRRYRRYPITRSRLRLLPKNRAQYRISEVKKNSRS